MRSQRALKESETWSANCCGETSGRGGGPLDLLAVLVRAGKEEGIVAEQAVATRNDIGRNRRIGVADVGARVDVVDRGSEIELLLGHGPALSLAGGAEKPEGPQFDPGKIKLKKLAYFSWAKNVRSRRHFTTFHHKFTTQSPSKNHVLHPFFPKTPCKNTPPPQNKKNPFRNKN